MKMKYTFILQNESIAIETTGDILLYLVKCEVLRKHVLDFRVGRPRNNINRESALVLNCSDSFINLMAG